MDPWPRALHAPETRARASLTLEAWERLEEDEPGELVRCELEEEELPDALHELAVSWLVAVFRAWLGERGGFVFGSELRLALSEQTGRKPDVTVLLPGCAPPPRRGALRSPPDLVVEVVTPSPRDERRDRIEKMGEYAVFGIRHYWVIDPALGSFEVFELGEPGRYTRVLAATEGVVAEIPGCPGLTLDLGALWAELDRLGPD
jgi:Uma2 family endonuclease